MEMNRRKNKKLIDTDPEVRLMYLLFRDKGWKPSDYFDMPESDKRIIKIFMKEELNEREKEVDIKE